MLKPFKHRFKIAWIKKGPSLLRNVFRIFSKINEFRKDYEEVKRWARPLHHVADLLHPDVDKSSEPVRFHMSHFLRWLESTYTNPQMNRWLRILKVIPMVFGTAYLPVMITRTSLVRTMTTSGISAKRRPVIAG
jgi:hypothetical protein